MKKNFYLFLDIDGVLNDVDFFKQNINKDNLQFTFNPKCVKALNFLIDFLMQFYNVELVISSSWRSNMNKTIDTLRNNKIHLENINLSSTKITNNKRGLEILDYLIDKKDADNYVIIDDEDHDFKEHFLPSKIIKTNFYHDSLDLIKVKSYLNNLGYSLDIKKNL